MSISVSLMAVFIPILLMGGIVGRLFREFTATLSLAIVISHGDLADHDADDVRADPAIAGRRRTGPRRLEPVWIARSPSTSARSHWSLEHGRLVMLAIARSR